MADQTKAFEKSVTFRMDSKDYRELERLAKESGVSVAWVLRHAVKQFLDSRPKQLHLL